MNFYNDSAKNECRLCLGEYPRILLFNTDTASQYRHKINICTGLEILENDKLPSSICERCSLELPLVYNFVVRSKESDRKLRVKCERAAEQELLSTNIARKEIPYEDLPNNFVNNNPYKALSDDKIEVLKKCNDERIDYEMVEDKLFALDARKDIEDTDQANKFNKKENRKVKKTKHKQNKTALQCYTCGLVAASVNALDIHSRTHTGERPYRCTHCGKSFAIKGTLNEHIYRLHTSIEKKSICENCGKQFVSDKDLKIHMRIHTGERPYICLFCNLSFTQHGTVVRHMRTHTGEKPFPCKVCGKHFAGQSIRNGHMRSHSNEKPFKCPTCEKHFKSRNGLLKHHQLHVGLKDNICDQCGAAFATKGNLFVHIKKVHSEKSGVCTVCDRYFSNLESHFSVHGGAASFQCHVCSRSFLRKCSLAIHLKKHFDAGKFQCKIEGCCKIFTMKSTLNFHNLKYHTTFTPHRCSHCAKEFSRVCDLARHVKIIHKIYELGQPCLTLVVKNTDV